MFTLDLCKDVSEIVDEVLLARVLAKHGRHVLLQVTYHVRVDLHVNHNIISDITRQLMTTRVSSRNVTQQ